VAEDRNLTGIIIIAILFVWRPPSAVAEDRNNTPFSWMVKSAGSWRSPSAAAEDRNHGISDVAPAVATVPLAAVGTTAEDRNHATGYW
jgi:hypothetical protein